VDYGSRWERAVSSWGRKSIRFKGSVFFMIHIGSEILNTMSNTIRDKKILNPMFFCNMENM
jgi:hypothetical protein